MKTLLALGIAASAMIVATPARAQIDSMSLESALMSNMEGSIRGCATPIMRILTKNPGAFRQTNSPNYKNNDVPYEFSTSSRTLEGVMLCPVSGHVPFGSFSLAALRPIRVPK